MVSFIDVVLFIKGYVTFFLRKKARFKYTVLKNYGVFLRFILH